MPVNIYAATAQDSLSPIELQLYHLIMDYRATAGLAAIPLSAGLNATAGRHALDTVENIWRAGMVLPTGANLHSWSDAPYYSDHRDPATMWDAPQRLGTSYSGNGYEISAAGYTGIAAALAGWQSSAGHNQVILNIGGWAGLDWTAIGIGVEFGAGSPGPYGGRVYHVWFGNETDSAGGPEIVGTASAEQMTGTVFADKMLGGDGNDTLEGGNGGDTLNGGTGDDFIFGGSSATDLRDVIYGGDGHDSIDGGYGNDDMSGGIGNDTVLGGFGSDTVIGNDGNDVLSGGAGSDLMFGNPGNDTLNGGFGYDRLNGGTGADSFFHLGVADHGSDWVQDYNAVEGDVLTVGIAGALRSQFQINTTFTPGAGAAGVAEAFVVYRPTGQILWALIDGADDAVINLAIGGQVFDLTA